jgi:DNA-binding transcriptional LysR family regulator
MDYNDLVLFRQVVDKGSITAAARALGLPKSSVSRGLARLEADLGLRLLHRTTRQLAVTDVGKTFFERVRAALSSIDDAAAVAKDAALEPSGVVRVTAPPDAASLGVADAAAEFALRYPKVQLEVVLTARVVDLVGEGFDIGVRAGRLADSGLVARRVGVVVTGLFAAPSYLAKRGRPQSVADLSEHECVLFRSRGRTIWTTSGDTERQSAEVRGAISGDDFSFVLQAVLAGAGIGQVPLNLGLPALRAGLAVRVLAEHRFGDGELHVVLPSAHWVPARVALFRDLLVERLSAVLKAAELECKAQR